MIKQFGCVVNSFYAFLGKLLFLASEGGLLVSLALLLVSLACVRHMCEPPLVRTSH